MDPERWKRIDEVFSRATELAPEERSSFVDGACEGDPELRQEVERLLALDETPGTGVEDMVSLPWSPDNDPMIHRELGVYRLTSRVAVGGMGVVYKAERTDGLFDQVVAVKLLRTGGDTESMLRRFDLERRTLASLRHPNIARLIDGGTSEDGAPYLVMEFIHGDSIDRYCEQHQLTIPERLRLFVTVCRAVHFAHQSLIVHRDLKPANILVDEHETVKLLDFGIARILAAEDEGGLPQLTRTLAPIFTPEYASPEQLRGESLTTATDVYSLGVSLYCLLTGTRPFRSESRSAGEWERIVTEKTPTRPSTAILRRSEDSPGSLTGDSAPEEFASSCASSVRKLRRFLSGDLDRIVLMALRKEPDRRYGSAQQLAEDIERFLDGKPIVARADSWVYRSHRFVLRNRIGVASATLVILALLIGIVASRRADRRATDEALHAQIEAESFRTIAGFVTEAFLTSEAFIQEDSRRQVLLTLHQKARQVRRQFADEADAHLRANLLEGLGRVCMELSLLAEAKQLADEALTIRREVFGSQSLEVALSLASLGELQYRLSDFEAAADLFVEVLHLHRTCERGVHTDVATAANNLATALRNTGDLDAAEELHLEALQLRREGGKDTASVAESLNNLAGLYLDKGEILEADRLMTEAVQIRQNVLGPEHPLTLQAISNLAVAKARLRKNSEAADLLLQAEEGYRSLQEAGRSSLAHVLAQRGSFLVQTGDLATAQSCVEESLEILLGHLGPDHPRVADAMIKLAIVQQDRDLVDAAGETWMEVLRIRELTLEPTDPIMGGTLRDYGAFLRDSGDFEEAEVTLRHAVEILTAQEFPSSNELGTAEAALGLCLADMDQNDEAVVLLRRGIVKLTQFRGEGDPEVLVLRTRLRKLLASPAGG